ncbi:MAG: TlpA family protein disulfide reductase [Deltaproteobacteria bacterium]|nr:MAG: TlpA family protein disulfide reductase [Deltaproteobacteria bacterium]
MLASLLLVPAAAVAGPPKAAPAAAGAEGTPAPSGPAEKKDAPKPVLSVGDKAPPFFLKTVNAETVGKRRVVLEEYFKDPETKAVVISFFATWCAPCKKELPVLQKLYEKYGQAGLRVVVISIDKEQEALKGLKAFVAERGLTFPVVSDRFNLLARRYLGNATALPSLFIADGEGRIAVMHQGYPADGDPAAFLEADVRKVMGLDAAAEGAGTEGG